MPTYKFIDDPHRIQTASRNLDRSNYFFACHPFSTLYDKHR